ncbi:MAG TPA: hypothetical protein VEQ65_13055 [Opitutus sp.]|nr:hypothetical protein [Opitutus sp.]
MLPVLPEPAPEEPLVPLWLPPVEPLPPDAPLLPALPAPIDEPDPEPPLEEPEPELEPPAVERRFDIALASCGAPEASSTTSCTSPMRSP